MADHGALKQVIEIGRVIVADWSDVYYLYKDVTVQEVALESATAPIEPFAVIKHGSDGYNVALLLAFVIAEGFPIHGTPIVLPPYFTEDLKFDAHLDEEETGNTGTASDDIRVKFFGSDGRELKK